MENQNINTDVFEEQMRQLQQMQDTSVENSVLDSVIPQETIAPVQQVVAPVQQVVQQVQQSVNSLNRDDLLSGGLAIVTTAFILTVFEIVFFYLVVSKDVESQMENGIKQGSKAMLKGMNVNPMVAGILSKFGFNETSDAVLQTLEDREGQHLNKINGYTKATGVLILASLMGVIYYFVKEMRIDTPVGRQGFNTAMWIAAVTVTALVTFQAFFYKFGQSYNYPGSLGNEEFLATVYNAIRV